MPRPSGLREDRQPRWRPRPSGFVDLMERVKASGRSNPASTSASTFAPVGATGSSTAAVVARVSQQHTVSPFAHQPSRRLGSYHHGSENPPRFSHITRAYVIGSRVTLGVASGMSRRAPIPHRLGESSGDKESGDRFASSLPFRASMLKRSQPKKAGGRRGCATSVRTRALCESTSSRMSK